MERSYKGEERQIERRRVGGGILFIFPHTFNILIEFPPLRSAITPQIISFMKLGVREALIPFIYLFVSLLINLRDDFLLLYIFLLL